MNGRQRAQDAPTGPKVALGGRAGGTRGAGSPERAPGARAGGAAGRAPAAPSPRRGARARYLGGGGIRDGRRSDGPPGKRRRAGTSSQPGDLPGSFLHEGCLNPLRL